MVNLLIPHTIDVKAIMDINGHKVGIESQGDPNGRLKESLSDFVKAKCSIIICATSVVRPTLLYIWLLWTESVPQVQSIQTPADFGCDCRYSS